MTLAEKVEYFNLSPPQRRLWRLGTGQAERDYRANCAFLIDGKVDEEQLRAALRLVVARNEILRTEFRRVSMMGLPLQTISENSDLFFTSVAATVVDVALLVADLNLDQSPASTGKVTATLHALAPNSHLLFLSMPALYLDSEGVLILLQELRDCYAACSSGECLPEDPIQYADVSEWMSERLQDEQSREEKDYWRKKIPNLKLNLRLPFERKSSVTGVFEPRYLITELDDAAQKLADTLGVPLSSVLLGAWQILLQKFIGEEQLTIGIASSGRGYEGLDKALGLFEKSLPLTAAVDVNLPASEFVHHVAVAEREAYDLQEFFSWEALSESANGDGGQPFIPYGFRFNRKPKALQTNGISFSLYHSFCCVDRFKLELTCSASDEGLSAELRYDPQAFQLSDLERLAQQYAVILRNLATDPLTILGRLEIHTTEERRRLVKDFNDNVQSLTSDRLLFQLFEDHARVAPGQTAVVYEDQHWSYNLLNRRANQLARHLHSVGVAPGSLVAICLNRSLESIMCLLAILKAGCAYVPVDPAQPKNRIAQMLDQLESCLIVTQQRLLPRLEGNNRRLVCLDVDAERIEQQSDDDLPNNTAPEDLCYVLFTSGSTGAPKGVAVEHRQVLNYLHAITAKLDLEPGGNYATVSTLAADLGNTALFPALSGQGCLHVVSTDTCLNPDAFASYMEQNKIDVLKIVPSHLEMLLVAERAVSVLPEKRLIVGGEALRSELIDKVRALKPACRTFNHYGPTETTVGALVYEVTREMASTVSPSSVPLGRPLAGVEVYVLDREWQPAPVWVTGEIYIGGAGLARGYLNAPELTAECFVPNPFSPVAGARLYRTGDKGRFLPDCTIEFLGRVDFQVKVRGYRIEIEEIERALRTHSNINQAIVLAQENRPGDVRLRAYVQPVEGKTLSNDELSVYLAQRLPEYMLPSSYFLLKHVPLTSNGKIDRRALATGTATMIDLSVSAVLPRNEAEQTIANIWQELLGLEKVGVYDNFFDLGGHSLLLAKVHMRLRHVFRKSVSVIDLFKYSTISSLSDFLTEENNQSPKFQNVLDRAARQRAAVNRRKQLFKEMGK
jgi:amino acid adenylation domain-containing protein